MRLPKFAMTVSVAAAMWLVPSASVAAMRGACEVQPATSQSQAKDATRAIDLMSAIRDRAENVTKETDDLANLSRPAYNSWRYNSYEYVGIRSDINAMGKDLCRLEVIRSEVPGWDQTAMDKIASELTLMQRNTTDAIDYMNAEHYGMWRPAFRQYDTALQRESHRLHNLLVKYVRYAKAQNQEQNLVGTLNTNSVS